MSIYDLLLNPQRTAFDYFVQGQQAKQQYDMNQQAMQARAQQMAQAEQMNPLLLQAQRAGIDLTQQQTATSATQGELFQKQVGSYEEEQELERRKQEALIEQANTGAGANRVQQQTAQFKLDQARKAQEDQEILEAEAALNQYEAIAQTDPVQAEAYKSIILKEYGITEDQVDAGLIKAKANIIKQLAPGSEWQQVQGMPGISFNPQTNTYSADAKTLQKAVSMKEKAKQKDSMIRGKDLDAMNKEVTKMGKEADQIISAAIDLQSLSADSNPVAQLGMIFKIMKAYDPTSVVREGEQDMLVKTGGIFDTFGAAIDNIRGGGKLSDETRRNIVQTANIMASNAQKAAEQSINSYLDVTSDYISASDMAKLRNRAPKFSAATPTATQATQPQAQATPQIPGGQDRIVMDNAMMQEYMK